MRIAIVKNGKCVNIAEAEKVSDVGARTGETLFEVDESVQIGFTYDGADFIEPEPKAETKINARKRLRANARDRHLKKLARVAAESDLAAIESILNDTANTLPERIAAAETLIDNI